MLFRERSIKHAVPFGVVGFMAFILVIWNIDIARESRVGEKLGDDRQ
jgi:hypothetical protein